MTHGQLGYGFHGNVAVPGLEQVRLEQPGNGTRIVQGRAKNPVLRCVVPIEETEHAGRRFRSRVAERRYGRNPFRCSQDLVRDIERQDGDRPAAAEHRVSGLRIDKYVEFCRRGTVAAFPHRAAHQHDAPHGRQAAGRPAYCAGDVGERPRRNERDGVLLCRLQRFDQVIHRMHRL